MRKRETRVWKLRESTQLTRQERDQNKQTQTKISKTWTLNKYKKWEEGIAKLWECEKKGNDRKKMKKSENWNKTQ